MYIMLHFTCAIVFQNIIKYVSLIFLLLQSLIESVYQEKDKSLIMKVY